MRINYNIVIIITSFICIVIIIFNISANSKLYFIFAIKLLDAILYIICNAVNHYLEKKHKPHDKFWKGVK